MLWLGLYVFILFALLLYGVFVTKNSWVRKLIPGSIVLSVGTAIVTSCLVALLAQFGRFRDFAELLFIGLCVWVFGAALLRRCFCRKDL